MLTADGFVPDAVLLDRFGLSDPIQIIRRRFQCGARMPGRSQEAAEEKAAAAGDRFDPGHVSAVAGAAHQVAGLETAGTVNYRPVGAVDGADGSDGRLWPKIAQSDCHPRLQRINRRITLVWQPETESVLAV